MKPRDQDADTLRAIAAELHRKAKVWRSGRFADEADEHVARTLDRLAGRLEKRAKRNERHVHCFVTDDDGVVHPCTCGAAWFATPGRST